MRPAGGAGIAPPVPLKGGGKVASKPAAPTPAMTLPSVIEIKREPGKRMTKEDLKKERRKIASERIAAFAETKPKKRDVREFFAARIAELAEDS
jgi:hypothetical protein